MAHPSDAGRVSLVVVNHNAGACLSQCVESGIEQAQEIIVVDNASTDESIAQLTTYFPDEPRLHVIQNDRNLGFAAACNIGANAANGDYIFFLNPDCVLESDAVSKLKEVLKANPAAGMAGGLLMNPDGTEQAGSRRAVPTPWRSFVRAFGLSRFAHRWPRLFFDFHLQRQPLPDQPVEMEAISGACMLVRRKAMEDVGPWDEGYFLHCEDLDLCMRFRQKAWQVMFVPSARVMHDQGACSRNRPVFVEWHKHRGMMRFYKKFFRHQYPSVLMWLVALGVWLRFAAVAASHTARHAVRLLGQNHE